MHVWYVLNKHLPWIYGKSRSTYIDITHNRPELAGARPRQDHLQQPPVPKWNKQHKGNYLGYVKGVALANKPYEHTAWIYRGHYITNPNNALLRVNHYKWPQICIVSSTQYEKFNDPWYRWGFLHFVRYLKRLVIVWLKHQVVSCFMATQPTSPMPAHQKIRPYSQGILILGFP